jgi:Phospholipase_D-nuclease N-terminal
MPLASSSYSYPLLGAFWTIFMIFLWVIWIWVLVRVFIDIFRSRDLSGWAKALWFLFVLFIPIIGVVVYLIARGDSMNERTAQQARQQDQEFRSYVQEAAADSPASTADQLAKLADLRDRGVSVEAARSHRGWVRSDQLNLPGPADRLAAVSRCQLAVAALEVCLDRVDPPSPAA